MGFFAKIVRKLVIGGALLVMAAVCRETAASTLYGAAYSGANGASTLYTISPATGVATPIGPIGFQRVSGIDFGPDGRLYGVGERSDGSNTNVLIVINTVTGAGTEVAPTGLAGTNVVTDISFRPSDGTLYAYQDGPDTILTINPATGAATIVGAPGPTGAGNGIAFSLGNVLYLVDRDNGTLASTLYTVNQTTGAATPVAGVTFAGFPPPVGSYRVNAMDAEPSSGILFTSVNDGAGGTGSHYLATIDKASGTVTQIGPTVVGLDAIAWQPDRCPVTLYGASHSTPAGASTLHRINPDTGAAVAIGPIGFDGVGGMDFNPLTKVLYAVGKRPGDQKDVLIKINPVSGAGMEVGPLVNAGSAGGGLFDVSFRSDGTLFLSAFGAGVFKLFTVSLSSGLATAVGNTGVNGGGNGLGFSLTDTLFQATTFSPNHTLYLMNQATGAATFSTAITYAGFPAPTSVYRSDAMDVDPSTGVPFVVVNDGSGGGGPTYLATLNFRTGRVNRIGLTTAGMDAIAWRQDCDDNDPCTFDECARCQEVALYGAAFLGPDGLATLYRIDPASGAAAAIGPIGFQRVSGMDFDPATGVLYATAERNDGSNTNVLITIDPSTGAGTEVGPTGIAGFGSVTEPDISFRNSDGKLYAYLDNNDSVATINTATGAATFVGPSGVPGFGNGLAYSNGDVLYHADGQALDTMNQATGADTFVAPLSYPGFPPPNFIYRVNAMDSNCAGVMYASVQDGGGAAPLNYLGTIDLASGAVTEIGPTVAGMDAIAWRVVRGVCRFTFVDTDQDGVCDGRDCAPADPTAFAVPGEVTIVSVQKLGGTSTKYDHTNADGGSGTLHDVVADTFFNLPVGPGGGAEFALCGYVGTSVTLGIDPPVNQGYWLVFRGHNACGAGSYGNTHTNPGPPLNGPPRMTTTCP